MTLDNLFPIGMSFVFPSEFDPITQLGGGWTPIAKEVSLPIGTTAPVITSRTENLNPGATLKWKDTNGNLITRSAGLTVTHDGGGTRLNELTGTPTTWVLPANLETDLSLATNAQTVSIWRRDS